MEKTKTVKANLTKEVHMGLLLSESVNGAIEEALQNARTAVYARLSAEFAEMADMNAGGVPVRKMALSSLYGKLGANGSNGHALNSTPGNHKVRYTGDQNETVKKVVAASAPAPVRTYTPEQKRKQKLHGRYVGLIAHASSKVGTAARKVFAEKGVRAAIAFLEKSKPAKKS